MRVFLLILLFYLILPKIDSQREARASEPTTPLEIGLLRFAQKNLTVKQDKEQIEFALANNETFLKADPHKVISAGKDGRLYLSLGEPSQLVKRLQKRNDQGLDILTVSSSTARDPDQWSRMVPSEKALRIAQDLFLRDFPRKMECKSQKDEMDNIEATSGNLGRDQIELDNRSFRSRSGAQILGLFVKGKVCVSDPYVTNQYYQKHWYFLMGDQIHEIGNESTVEEQQSSDSTGRPSLAKRIERKDRRRSIEPIDAADFDSDGKSEWIFRENGSGAGDMGRSSFILFDDRLNKLATASTSLESLPQENLR